MGVDIVTFGHFFWCATNLVDPRYLKEEKPHGSAGGFYCFRDAMMEDCPVRNTTLIAVYFSFYEELVHLKFCYFGCSHIYFFSIVMFAVVSLYGPCSVSSSQ